MPSFIGFTKVASPLGWIGKPIALPHRLTQVYFAQASYITYLQRNREKASSTLLTALPPKVANGPFISFASAFSLRCPNAHLLLSCLLYSALIDPRVNGQLCK